MPCLLRKSLHTFLDDLNRLIGIEIAATKESADTNGQETIIKSENIKTTILISAIALIVIAAFIAIIYVPKFIVNRLIDVYKTTDEIAAGNLDIDIKQSGRDELAKMAQALVKFRDNAKERIKLEEEQKQAEARQAKERKDAMMHMASQFEAQVGEISQTVVSAVQQMQTMTKQLSGTINSTSEKSVSVADAANQTSANVQTVAAAVEEMNASINDISANITSTMQTSKQYSASALNLKVSWIF